VTVEGIGNAGHVAPDAKRIGTERDRCRIAHLCDTAAVEVDTLSRRGLRRRRCGNEAGGWSRELLFDRKQKIDGDRRVMLGKGAHHVAAQGVRVLHRERRMVGFEEEEGDDGVNRPWLHDADIDLARLDARQRLTK
jgi:hypothetical protein